MKVKNIMFSGFAAAILMGAVDANAAGLSIASQEYVDSKVSTEKTARENEDTAINNKIGGSYTAQSTVHAAIESKASQADFNTLNTTVTAEGTGLVDKVTALEEKAGTGSVESQINAKLGDLGTDATTGEKNTVEDALAANSAADKAYAKDYADSLATNYQAASASNVTGLEQGSHLTAGNGVAANLKALDTNLRTAESTIASHATSIANNATAISTETTNRTDADTALSGRLDTVEETLGTETTDGLVKDVADLKNNMGEGGSVASQIESVVGNLGTNATTGVENTVEEALAKKVDKTTTVNAKALSGNIVLDGGDVAVKTGYAKATAAEAIAAGNTIDSALGKLEYKADANANAIAALNNTYATDAEVNAKFGGVANALPEYTDCTAESGQCVLSVDKTTGALTWVAVTPTPTPGI